MVALMARLNPSTVIMKRKDESESPCLIPLEGGKGFDGIPLIRMENRADDVTLTIQETHVGSNPKARRVEFK
jgi:hypothetical protein